MNELKIPNMTCSHCVARVTQALSAYTNGRIKIDLPSRTVKVSSDVSRQELVGALAKAGYPPA